MRRFSPVIPFSVSPFLDGYLTVAAGFVIAGLRAGGAMSAAEASLYAGLFLLGTFLGAVFSGRLADRFGRRPFFLAFPLLCALAAAVPFFSAAVTTLIAVQCMLGLLIGGDTPVSQAAVTEMTPVSRRGKALSFLMFSWFVGALAGVAAAVPIAFFALPWPVFYVVPVLLFSAAYLMRLSIPESALWRRSRRQHCVSGEGKNVLSGGAQTTGLLRPSLWQYRRAVLFCCGFWLSQTIPVTAIMMFSPVILERLTGTDSHILQVGLLYAFFLAGVLPVTFIKKAFNKEKLLTRTFVAMGIALLAVAACGPAHPTLMGTAFIFYAFAYGMQTTLDYVYPNVLFPTALRSTASGVILGISRVGSAASAFAFPFLLDLFTAKTLIISGAVISLLGVLWLLVLPENSSPGDEEAA